MKTFEIKNADCREVMRSLPENSIDSIVTDPPYGLEFMGKGWDRGVPGIEFWTEALRVLKPGGHLLAFGGTRTFHRLTVAIEDSGFEIRDCLGWIYGSGFPKSHNISKAIEAKIITGGSNPRQIRKIEMGKNYKPHKLSGTKDFGISRGGGFGADLDRDLTESLPIENPEAAEWSGWGTALKPAWEPIILARKPLAGTVAQNVLEFRTGGLNIDAARVGETEGLGRWPANILHDGSEEAIGIFPETTSGILKPSHFSKASEANCLNGSNQARHPRGEFGGDSGSAARFFYCAKASKADRNEGLEEFQIGQTTGGGGGIGNYAKDVNSASGKFGSEKDPARNIHPTVKPSALMQYLCRLVTAPGGLILDPFAGSGSTGKAAIAEGFRFLGAELDPAYAEIARARCEAAAKISPEITEGAEDSAQLHLFGEG